jgi:uncharacterized protein YybS (DUF2232 family)
MDPSIVIIIGLVVSLIGSSFIATKVFKALWKTEASSGMMTAYLSAFLISFMFILVIIYAIVANSMSFSR